MDIFGLLFEYVYLQLQDDKYGWSQNAAQQYYNDYQQSQQYQSGYPGNSYNNNQYNGGSFYGN